jgi:hypothetical protein
LHHWSMILFLFKKKEKGKTYTIVRFSIKFRMAIFYFIF